MSSKGDGGRCVWLDSLLFLLLLFVGGAGLALVASATGVASGESVHHEAARSLGLWFDEIGRGESSFFDRAARERVWAPVHAHVSLPTMLSGLVWHVATSGYAWWGELLSLRLGYAWIAALSLPLLYGLVAPAWGRRAALLSAAFLAFVPRALHQAALADPQAVTVTGWLLVLLLYARARRAICDARPGIAVLWSLGAAAALGAGLASSKSTLAVLIVLTLHTLWAERRNLRVASPGGLIPVPATILPILVLAPAAFLLATPWLWNGTAERLSPMLVRAFTPSSPKGEYGWWFGLLSVVASLPAVTLFAAALGSAVTVGPDRFRRWASKEAPAHDELGSLVVVGLAVGVGWVTLAPSSVQTSPPSWLLAVPFLAALAGLGLDRTLREVGTLLGNRSPWLRSGLAWALGLWVLSGPACQTLSQSQSRSAAFPPLSGGSAWVASSERLPLHDGSVAVGLVASIDALDRSHLTVFSPEVPAEVWAGMHRRGQMRTVVKNVGNPEQADLLVVGPRDADRLDKPGSRPRRHLARVQRDGLVLLDAYDGRR